MGSLAEAITSWTRIVGRVRYESTGRRGSSRGAPLQQRLVETPGEDVRGRHLDDDRVRRRDRRLFAVLRILLVEAVARPPEARPPPDQLRGGLDHDAADLRPIIRVKIDGHGDPGGLAEVLYLAAVVAGAGIDLVAR